MAPALVAPALGTCAWHLRCVAEFSRIGSRRRLAAPLARRERRALPWEARPPDAGPHHAEHAVKMPHVSVSSRAGARSLRAAVRYHGAAG